MTELCGQVSLCRDFICAVDGMSLKRKAGRCRHLFKRGMVAAVLGRRRWTTNLLWTLWSYIFARDFSSMDSSNLRTAQSHHSNSQQNFQKKQTRNTQASLMSLQYRKNMKKPSTGKRNSSSKRKAIHGIGHGALPAASFVILPQMRVSLMETDLLSISSCGALPVRRGRQICVFNIKTPIMFHPFPPPLIFPTIGNRLPESMVKATPRATLPQHGGGDVACGGGSQLPGAWEKGLVESRKQLRLVD